MSNPESTCHIWVLDSEFDRLQLKLQYKLPTWYSRINPSMIGARLFILGIESNQSKIKSFYVIRSTINSFYYTQTSTSFLLSAEKSLLLFLLASVFVLDFTFVVGTWGITERFRFQFQRSAKLNHFIGFLLRHDLQSWL